MRGITVLGLLLLAFSPLPLAFVLPPRAEVTLLVGGLVVQCLGFATSWIEINSALKAHGLPGPLRRLRLWIWPPPGKYTLNAEGGSLIVSLGLESSGRVRTGKGNFRDYARIVALEKNLQSLEAEVLGMRQEIQGRISAIARRIDEEAQKLDAAASSIRAEMTNTAISGLDLRLLGLVWFVVGSLWSTFAGLLGPAIG